MVVVVEVEVVDVVVVEVVVLEVLVVPPTCSIVGVVMELTVMSPTSFLIEGGKLEVMVAPRLDSSMDERAPCAVDAFSSVASKAYSITSVLRADPPEERRLPASDIVTLTCSQGTLDIDPMAFRTPVMKSSSSAHRVALVTANSKVPVTLEIELLVVVVFVVVARRVELVLFDLLLEEFMWLVLFEGTASLRLC